MWYSVRNHFDWCAIWKFRRRFLFFFSSCKFRWWDSAARGRGFCSFSRAFIFLDIYFRIDFIFSIYRDFSVFPFRFEFWWFSFSFWFFVILIERALTYRTCSKNFLVAIHNNRSKWCVRYSCKSNTECATVPTECESLMHTVRNGFVARTQPVSSMTKRQRRRRRRQANAPQRHRADNGDDDVYSW